MYKLVAIENGTTDSLYSKLTGKTRKTIGYFDSLEEVKNHMKDDEEYEIRKCRENGKTFYKI